MSVLDTFLIVFDSDTKKAEDGYQKVEDLAKRFVAFAGAYFAIDAFKQRAEEVETLARAADSLGASVSDLDAFTQSAVKLGGDVQGTLDSITDMAETIGEVVSDPESMKAESFKAIGLAAKDMNGNVKDGLTGLLDLADAVQGMDRQKAIFRMKEIGITDNRTIDLILKGRKAIEEMMDRQKKFGVVTQEDTDALRAFRMAVGDSGLSLGFWLTKITTAVLPTLTTMVDAFNRAAEYLTEHKALVVSFIAAIAAVVAVVYLPAMIAAAAATVAAFAPVIAIGAAVAAIGAAFALAAEDVYAFTHGQASMIGEISKQYPIVGELVREVIAYFGLLFDVTKAMGLFLRDLFVDPSHAIENFRTTMRGALDDFVQAFGVMTSAEDAFISATQAMNETLADIWDSVADGIMGAINSIAGKIATLRGAFGGLFGGETTVTGTMQTAQATMQAVQSAPLASVPSSAIGAPGNVQKSQTVNVGDVLINTQASDPEGVKTAFSQGLTDQIRQANAQFDDGVLR